VFVVISLFPFIGVGEGWGKKGGEEILLSLSLN
jgi:hypothetical protein